MGWFRRASRRGEPAARGVDAVMRTALRRVLEQDLDAAEELLAGVARGDSSQVEAYLALARLYRLRGEIGRAIRIHQNLLLRRDLADAHRDEALSGLAGDFRKGGFLQRAIAAYEELLERRPKDAAGMQALTRLYADARDFEKAVDLERRCARLQGRDGREAEAELLVEMAEAAHAEGRNEDARRALKKALRRDARCVRAWIRLGSLEVERGRSKRALAAWSKVPELDRRSAAQIYPRLAAAFAAVGRPRDYEAELRRLLEDRPGDGAARLALVQALAARGETAAALEEAREYAQRDPDSLQAQATLARSLIADGRETEAVKEFEGLLEMLERQGALTPRESIE